MRAEEMIKNYKKIKLELQVTEMQLQRFTGVTEDDVISMMSFSHPSGDERVQTSGTSDKTAKVALNYRKVMARENDAWYDFLLKRYLKLKEEIEFFEDSVKRLSGKLPDIMTEIMEGILTWDEIADKYDISRRSIGNYKKRAIEELDRMYEVRESCVADYLLS